MSSKILRLILPIYVAVLAVAAIEPEPDTLPQPKLNSIDSLQGHCADGECRNFNYSDPDEVAFFDLKAEVRIASDSTYDLRSNVDSDTLAFANSTFTHFPLHLFYSIGLRELDMRNCSIEFLSWDAFLMADKLNVLLLSNNLIESIDASTFNYAYNLQYLFLDSNRIHSLVNESFKGLNQLKYLNLEGNRLQTLPWGVFQTLPALREINLAENRLRSIEQSLFSDNRGLTTVTFKDNELSVVSEKFLMFKPSLEVVDLSNNAPLEVLVLNVDSQYLFATNCSLNRINIYGRVPTVDLRHNQISELYFSQPEFLNELNLGNNSLQQIASLEGAKRLKVLNLADNPQLGEFPDLNGVVPLQELNISNTGLTALPINSIASLSHLRILNVANNKIREINPKDFQYIMGLKKFYIHRNDWNCYNLQLVMDQVIRDLHIQYSPDVYDPDFPGQYLEGIACMYRLEDEDEVKDTAESNGVAADSNTNEKLMATSAEKEGPSKEVETLRRELKAIVSVYEQKFKVMFGLYESLNKRLERFENINKTVWDHITISV